MELTGLHLLLTHQCNYECDHCFVWGSPSQSGTMTLRAVRHILQEAQEAGTVKWIYFEGGEPFLYYPVMLKGVQEAAALGFQVGIVSNSYWATEIEDAIEWLRPMTGLIQDLSVSVDAYHGSEESKQLAGNVRAAAQSLGMPVDGISIAQPQADSAPSSGQLPPGESEVMYRGRAVEQLAARATSRPWQGFTECPHEDLRQPGRLHVDPFGNLHICQGISIGNLFQMPLRDICAAYDPVSFPIVGPLLEGGPAELVRRYGLSHDEGYADACHLCYQARRALRQRFPQVLLPDQMYGVFE